MTADLDLGVIQIDSLQDHTGLGHTASTEKGGILILVGVKMEARAHFG
jgi:hypothetical protein